MADPRKPDPSPASEVQGEGDYISARKYQKEQHRFAEDEERVERKAREAADALDGVEGEALEKAEDETRTRRPEAH